MSFRSSLKQIAGIVLAASFVLMTFGGAEAATIAPVVDGVVRDAMSTPKDGNPDNVINRSVIQSLDVERQIGAFEDRGIIEFDISGWFDVPTTLYLPVFASMGPFPFIIDVNVYAGDGAVGLNDFNAGTLFTSFVYAGESRVKLDVTTAIETLKSSGEDFIGFNFQFAVPSMIPLNGPFVAFNSLEFGPPATLRAIPLPGAFALLLPAFALLGFLSRGVRRKRNQI